MMNLIEPRAEDTIMVFSQMLQNIQKAKSCRVRRPSYCPLRRTSLCYNQSDNTPKRTLLNGANDLHLTSYPNTAEERIHH